MADLTITIVLYNSAGQLEGCLASLRSDLDAQRARLVAVDNASPDDSGALVRTLVPHALVIDSPTNVGFAAGCNLAWPHVDTRYWLLLNPDTIVEPDTIARLVAFMDRHPEVGAASPWLRVPDYSEREFPGRARPSAWLALLELTRAHKLLPRSMRARLLQGPYVPSDTTSPPEPDWLPGTALIARADAVREVGPLDKSYFLYGEDLEWCWRMRRAGWRLAVVDAIVSHQARASGEATWSKEAIETRMADGMVRAIRATRGQLAARASALAYASGLALESRHPRRSADQRENARRAARAWWDAFKHA